MSSLYQVVEICEIITAADREIPDDLLIISCEEDRDICLPFIDQGYLYQFNTIKFR